MGLFSTPAPAVLDPGVLIAAVHEIGHAVSARAHRIGVRHIRMGSTLLDLPRSAAAMTAEQWHGYLVGCWAGYEAEVLWSRRHGGRADKHQSGIDIRNFRDCRHHIGLSEGAARSAARTVLRRDWDRVERLTPRLAQNGRITPW
jgi:hypothetical protein